MEYENMRMPELKSLARDRRLRGYSRMSKAELVAFLTIWVKIILRCVGPNRRAGAKPSSGTCSCTRFQCFIKPLDLQSLAQCLYIWGQYINWEKNKVTK